MNDQDHYNRAYSARRLKDIGLVGLGTGLGGGLGWLVGNKLGDAVIAKPHMANALRYGLPTLGALAAGYVANLEVQRREAEQRRAHEAGVSAVKAIIDKENADKEAAEKAKPQENQAKVANAILSAMKRGAVSPITEIARVPSSIRAISGMLKAGKEAEAAGLLESAASIRRAAKETGIDTAAGLAAPAGVTLAGLYLGKKALDGKEKTARILASPQEWTEEEKGTGMGAAAGALGGLVLGGMALSKTPVLHYALPAAAVGALLARKQISKRREEAARG